MVVLHDKWMDVLDYNCLSERSRVRRVYMKIPKISISYNFRISLIAKFRLQCHFQLKTNDFRQLIFAILFLISCNLYYRD